MTRLTIFLAAGLAVGVEAAAQTPAFAPGSLALVRLGDGVQSLVSSGNEVFVDNYSTNGTLLASFALPTNGSLAFLISGAASTEGGLTRSLDHTVLALAGYRTNYGALSKSLSSTAGTEVAREVATVDAFGNFAPVQFSSVFYSGANIRCAATDGTNNFWTAGSSGGAYYFNGPSTPAVVESGVSNTRYIKAVAGNLYFSTQAGTAGIYGFTPAGLPAGAATTNLLFATGSGSQVAGFDLNPTLTIAYVADQNATAGGVQKWVNESGVWTLAYTIATGAGAFSVAADFSGTVPVVYATTGESVSNRLVVIIDTGASAQAATIATAGAGRYFRGLDFAPDLRPFFLSQPQSVVTTNGATVTLAAQVGSASPFGCQWQRSGTNLAGATKTALTFQPVAATNQGPYQLVATNAHGAVTSLVATLTVDASLVRPVVFSQPQSQSAAIGGGTTLTVAALGTAPLSYQWWFGSTLLVGQTTAALSLSCLGTAAQGPYSVVVTNAAGAATSQAAVLTVVSPAPAAVSYTNPGSVYTQSFDGLPGAGLLTVDAANPVVVSGQAYDLANPFDFAFPQLACGGLEGGLGLTDSLAGWYGYAGIEAKFGASEGDQSTGGVISFGTTNSLSGSANRALGLLATSSTGGTAFGLKLINGTGTALTQISLTYTGELWRQAAVPKTLAFAYWIDPPATGAFPTNFTAALPVLNVSFPTNPAAATPVPVDGTQPTNQLAVAVANQTITNWPPGAALWLVWSMSDPTGKGQGLAIDNLSFSATSSTAVLKVPLWIGVSGGNASLAWPLAFTNVVLQSNPSLHQSNGWSPVTQPWHAQGGSNVVTLPVGAGPLYFRLVP